MQEITVDAYSAAVETCLELAVMECGGSRVAAQVLLSAYNGATYQVDIVELGLLSRRYYEAALAVIRGRIELGMEPHTVVNNGKKIFHRLTDDWSHYRLTERAKKRCRYCDGRGERRPWGADEDAPEEPCKHCGGAGRVCACHD